MGIRVTPLQLAFSIMFASSVSFGNVGAMVPDEPVPDERSPSEPASPGLEARMQQMQEEERSYCKETLVLSPRGQGPSQARPSALHSGLEEQHCHVEDGSVVIRSRKRRDTGLHDRIRTPFFAL